MVGMAHLGRRAKIVGIAGAILTIVAGGALAQSMGLGFGMSDSLGKGGGIGAPPTFWLWNTNGKIAWNTNGVVKCNAC